MSGPFASVNGLQIVSGSLVIPLVGLWTADLQIATNQLVTGPVSIVIGNLTLAGTVYRSEGYGGQTKVRVVAGAGGWRTSVPAQGYGSSAGVKISTILTDVAQAAGETIVVASDTTIGNGYARVAFGQSVAADVLWHMVEHGFIPAWYVDPSGKTQTVAWSSNAISTPFTVVDQRPDQGVVVIATEDYASWMPGCTFSNPLLTGTYTSAGVHYTWDPGGVFRFEVMTSGADGQDVDRVLSPIQQVVQKEIAFTRFHGRYAYTVSNPTSSTIDCSPANTKLGLPTLQNVPLCSWVAGTYTPTDGSACHIEFVDGITPVCVWTAMPTGTNPVARLGDQTQSFLPPTTLIVGTVSGAPFSGTLMSPTPITGTITQGSQQVNTQ